MPITRVSSARMLQPYGTGVAHNGDWEGYTLQRLDNGRVAAVWKTLAGSTETMRMTTLDALGASNIALSVLDSGPTNYRLQLPAIASNPSGGFFAVWEHDATAATPLAGNTYGRAFNAAGTALTSKAHLSTASGGGEYTPSVATLGNGSYIVTWADTLASPAFPPSSDVMARIYTQAGIPVGGEFRLNTTTAGIQLGTDLLSLGDGRTLAVWGNAAISGMSVVATELRGRFIAANGTGSGVDFQIDTIAPGSTYQDESFEVLGLGNGGFVVVWEEETKSSVEEIHFQRFNGAGAKLGGEVVAESTGGSYDITQMLVTELANGGFAIAWRVFDDVSGSVTSHVRQFGYSGAEIDTETSLNAIAGPDGLVLTADLELMANGNVMGIGVTNAGVATQVFDFGDERLLGTSAAETLWGKHGVHDRIYGLASNDTLYGLGGNDVLDGGTGADRMVGGANNDTYYVDNTGDVVVEVAGGGTDTVNSTIAYTLGAEVENLTLLGTASIGGAGNTLNNRIVGNAGNNTLAGRLGNDTLTGGAGQDAFIFDTALNAASNLDTITDFNVADDTIRLENAIFTNIVGAQGTYLGAGQFRIGTSALDADDRIIYNSATGALLYDSNGSAAGGVTEFSKLAAGLALTSADFLII